MVRELSRKLSTLKEFADAIIAELRFRRGTFSPGIEILKSTRRINVIRVTSTRAELIVKLLTPRSPMTIPIIEIGSGDSWKVFTAEEISAFVKDVGDSNTIHPPIVPGLLILETLLATKTFSTCAEISLKFKNFVVAEESLTLNENQIRSANELKIIVSGA